MIVSAITCPRRAGGVSPLIVYSAADPSIRGLTPPARLAPARPALTLLEVLIALAIFLMAMVVFGEMIVRNGQIARDIQRQNLATRLCKSKLQEVLSGAVPLTSQGDEAFDEEPDYTWSLQADSGAVDGLWNVTVTVTCKQADAADPIQVAVTQMVLDPSIEGSTQDATPVSASPANTNGLNNSAPMGN